MGRFAFPCSSPAHHDVEDGDDVEKDDDGDDGDHDDDDDDGDTQKGVMVRRSVHY